MALLQNFTLDTGLEIVYHRIISISVNWVKESGTIVLGSYVDRPLRLDKPRTGIAKEFRVNIPTDVFRLYLDASSAPNDSVTDPEEANELNRELAYELVKMLDERFADATDA